MSTARRWIDRFVPAALLAAYALTFGAIALGTDTLVYDDHPGQFYRMWHMVMHGPAPWAWAPGWWGGFPELQFYPPGFGYLGELLYTLALGRLSVTAVYQIVVWLAYLLPGATTFLLFVRLTGSGWLALPTAFVALTLSRPMASGVWGGVQLGMLGARIAWGLLPLLVLALFDWTPAARQSRVGAALLVAAITITHPIFLPAAVLLVGLAADGAPGSIVTRAAAAFRLLAVAAALTAFWWLPMLAHLDDSRAMGFGVLDPEGFVGFLRAHPLLALLLVLAALAPWLARSPAERVVARFPWVMLLVVAADALVLEPLGVSRLPAPRVIDAAWLAVSLAGGLALVRVLSRMLPRVPVPALGVAAVVLLAGFGVAGTTLMLHSHADDWPHWSSTVSQLHLDALWTDLRQAPPGRILFVASNAPLAPAPARSPHTHFPSVTPIVTGRGIIGGTYTHPSAVAAIAYRGVDVRDPVGFLVERIDGVKLLGRPIREVDEAMLAPWASRFGISTVVALELDADKLRAFDADPALAPLPLPSPFIGWTRRAPVAIPLEVAPGRWRIQLTGEPGAFVPARLAFYPLWHAFDGDRPLAVRRGPLHDLEVQIPRSPVDVELRYGAGSFEWAGVAVSVLAAVVAIGLGVRDARRRRSKT